MRKAHGITLSLETFLHGLVWAGGIDQAPEEMPKYPPRASRTDPTKPVQGLYMYNGYMCTASRGEGVCGYTARVAKSMRNHFSHDHKGKSHTLGA